MKFLVLFKILSAFLFNYFIFAKDLFTKQKLTSILSKNKNFYDFTKSAKYPDFIVKKIIKILNRFNCVHSTVPYVFLIPEYRLESFNVEFVNEMAEIISFKNKISLDDLALCVFTYSEKSSININFEMYIGLKIQKLMQNNEKRDYINIFKNEIAQKIKSSGINFGAYYFVKNLFEKLKKVPKNITKKVSFHSNLPVKNERLKRDMIKSIFLLPVILILCYYMFVTKTTSELKNLEIYMNKWKYLKGKIKSTELCDKSCIICLEEFLNYKILSPSPSIEDTSLLINENELNFRVLKLGCGHLFHPDCVNKWIKKQKTCPTCRQEIEFKKIQLYKIEC